MIINKYKATYRSLTAIYNCGIYYAETKEEAEREARANASAFTANEKCLIHCDKIE